MKLDIENLKKSLKEGYETFYQSRLEGEQIEDMYHGRQFTDKELNDLNLRGQPAEIFNVIKLFTRQLIGYYSTTINTAKTVPKQYQDITTASLLNDIVSYVNRTNNFDNEGDKIKQDLFLTGLCASYTEVVEDEGKTDDYGRKLYKIVKRHIPSSELILDPDSVKSDYSDSRYLHRYKWLNKEQIVALFGADITSTLEEWYNFTDIEEADYDYAKVGTATFGGYRYYEQYLIVHTIAVDDDGEVYNIYWSGNKVLLKEKLPYTNIVNPYTLIKLHDSTKSEYYSLFRDVVESQRAINQAIVQIQLMANTNKLLVSEGAVKDMSAFIKAYKRVNAVIPVINHVGIKEINLSGEVQHQYMIIDKSFERIQRVLGINDSFLGMAYAADSGRKVKLQQNATIMALRYINNKLELFYRLNGWKTVELIKQYFRANQAMRIADDTVGERWIEVNAPLLDPNTGEPYMEESIDPETGEPELDKYGNIIMIPLNHADTDISFTDVDIEVETVAYNDEDEKAQLLLETFIGGNIGQALMTVNPTGFFKAAGLNVKGMKSKYSMDLADILDQTAQMLQPQPQRQTELGGGQVGGQSANSQSLKLPQNTNEGE